MVTDARAGASHRASRDLAGQRRVRRRCRRVPRLRARARPADPARPIRARHGRRAGPSWHRSWRKRAMNEQLVERIRQCPNLPSLPTIAMQVLELAQKPEVDIAEIARIICKDPALSSKILRTVNSS